MHTQKDKDSTNLWASLLKHTKNFQDRMSIYSACKELIPCRKCEFMSKKLNKCTYKDGAKSCEKW